MRTSKKHVALWEVATQQMSDIVAACEEDREASINDRRFVSIPGAMWEGAVGEQFANRPKLEINKVHRDLVRVFNEYRNNRFDATFISKDGKDSDEFADVLAGLYRSDQQDSNADEAHDNAFEEGVSGGFGAFRLRAEYEDEYDPDNERQRICWEPITDADSCVYFDLDSKRQDKSDARYCFVLTGMTKDAYAEEWGDDLSTWPKQIDGSDWDWRGPDLVYVAEYYVVEEANETQLIFRDISGATLKYWADQIGEDEIAEMEAVGTQQVASRKIKNRRIHKYILSGRGVLEDAGYIAGREIPIVPYFGKRWFVDGRERFMGHVRLAKDAQRLYNMQISALALASATGGEEIPIFTPEQVQGHESAWAEKAIRRPAYLLVNPLLDKDGNEMPAGPVDYSRPAQVPPAMAALLELSNADIQDILGNQDAGEEVEGNISGKAVELVQNRLDMQAYIYMSNFAKSVRRAACIWLSMASEIYGDDTRKSIDEQGEVEFIDLAETTLSKDGAQVPKYDFQRAKHDVHIEIGPTSQSRRSATVRALTQMLPLVSDPADQAVLSSMALMNMDGEGMGPTRDYFRKKMVRMGVIEPTDAEAEEMAAEAANQQPSAQDQYLMSEAQKAQAQALESQADAEEAIANTQLKRAQTAETLAGIDRDDRAQALETAKAIADAATAPLPNGARPATTPRQ